LGVTQATRRVDVPQTPAMPVSYFLTAQSPARGSETNDKVWSDGTGVTVMKAGR
jgi:hypothetical protein